MEEIIPMPPHARVVPVSPSYFSRREDFLDKYLALQALERKYGRLPTRSNRGMPVRWVSAGDYKKFTGLVVPEPLYRRALWIAKKLNRIHPALRPPAVDEELSNFKRSIEAFRGAVRPVIVDRFGRALGTGRRKTSVARAWVVEGTGEVLINGKSLAEAFGRVHDRESATWALRSTDRMDKYNVWALVEGGGTTGQAEALALAVSKALLAHEPALKATLRKGELRQPAW